jgi:uncharacterized protein (DUF1015 family)
MAIIKPFSCIRPESEVAAKIAALPYDVYNREEAKTEVLREPLSFLSIDRAETFFDNSVDTYDERVYQKAKEILDDFLLKGHFIKDNEECYYIYELIMNERSQTGLVACASIDDYHNNIIKKHENTRADKEIDRIKHVDTLNAQTGPIFLAYPSHDVITNLINEMKKEEPLYHFRAEDLVYHNVWKINNTSKIEVIKNAFLEIKNIYIADGHHRAASAVKVGELRRKEKMNYTGEEEFNYFLSVLFPENELMIMPYNRVVKDLNGLTTNEFLDKLECKFTVHEIGTNAYQPDKKGLFGMYLEGKWFQVQIKDEYKNNLDPVESLDVSILQNHLLSEVLGIGDPRIDKRIDFIGGIRGLSELEQRANTDMKVAFSMYPTSINELFAVSDENKLMPPKSTWFEPKLRSGLFIHELE